ncbi:hypothetical protein SERLA73DRAFT_45108, partial [Serpula lacrymans var. lacrymans S7.3]
SLSLLSVALVSNSINRQCYHTLVLTGEGWMHELVEGHPGCICCELGVSKDVFIQLVKVLCGVGHQSTKYILTEEKLGIFLYISLTGLSVTTKS